MYIEDAWLKVTAGKSLYYPAAGEDIWEAIHLFHSQISKFYFCDIRLPTWIKARDEIAAKLGCSMLSSVQSGDMHSRIELKCDDSGRQYRFLNPSRLTFKFGSANSQKVTEVIYRRGFGEMGLAELNADELGVFMHRGDGCGEGGSSVYYLANKKKRFPPLAMLFNTIASKAGMRMIVVSDGSNTDIQEIRKYHHSRDSGKVLYQQLCQSSFEKYGFRWRCIGWLGPRYGPTLIWGLTSLG